MAREVVRMNLKESEKLFYDNFINILLAEFSLTSGRPDNVESELEVKVQRGFCCRLLVKVCDDILDFSCVKNTWAEASLWKGQEYKVSKQELHPAIS